MTVEQGDAAPTFALPGNDGRTHRLEDYAGRRVVLYFYPKDDTPGCTTQACDFRDNMARLTAAGAVVLGVSRDARASHDAFRDKYDLNFVLLTDEDVSVHRAYGAFGEKKSYGRTVEGVIRSTFIIDGDGVVTAAMRNVRAGGHVDRVLATLEEG
ncbi:MAG: thioredoxin-dependent thiol peroxidase [Myxococcota bacterium]